MKWSNRTSSRIRPRLSPTCLDACSTARRRKGQRCGDEAKLEESLVGCVVQGVRSVVLVLDVAEMGEAQGGGSLFKLGIMGEVRTTLTR